MLKDKKRIISLIKIVPVLGIFVISFSLIIVSILGINKYFDDKINKDVAKIKYEAIYSAKKHIKAASGLIDNVHLIVKKSYQREIKIAVKLGYSLLSEIYQENKNLPKKLILKKIKSKLENIRFYNDKSGYYYIYGMNGKLIMLPIKKKLEGRNFYNYQDIMGKYVIRDIIQKLKNNSNGIFDEWYYYKPNTTLMLKKIGYVKYFEPLNIFIGSAVYEDNIHKEVFKRIRTLISRLITVFKKKNLTIISDDGKIIFSKDYTLNGKNYFQKYKEIINLAHKNKENILKAQLDDKLVIFKYYEPLHFTLLQEINLKQMKKNIEQEKNSMDKVVSSVIKQFLTTAIIFIIIILSIIMSLTKMIEKIFKKYDEDLIKEKERAESGAKAKSEFLANMSHEIRTPLNAILGFIQILEEKNLDEESNKYLQIIETSGKDLVTIINDILDFSKIEAGKFKIEEIEFNPKKEFEIVKELFTSKASEKNILLEMNAELKYNIVSDPTRLKQVIANLLSNAIKFTKENKKITLNIKYDDKNETLFVEVIDEGIGIAADKLGTIFQAFSQADTSTTRKYGGTGLGLTISYKLIQLLGGELKVESEIGKGSRFYFYVPAKKTILSKNEESESQKGVVSENFDFFILLVEDNKANQMFMSVILKKMGIKFDIANDGIEAIEKFKSNRYDLILMDENMPNLNGIEATKKIREIEREEGLNRIVIIALTANAMDGDKDRFILAGMDYYLSKPLDIEKLKTILEKLK